MRALLLVAALSVGLENALLYSTVGNSPWGGPFVWTPDPRPVLAANMVLAALAALVITGTLVRFSGRVLRGRFLARYGLMVNGGSRLRGRGNPERVFGLRSRAAR